jgi:sugar fermentation stimulation protein A
MISKNEKTRKFSGIPWPKLTAGKLIKRYKRFLADVELKNGQTITAHCPNSGSMKECSEPGRTVYLSHHSSPKRKLKYTWELIDMPDSLVGVNTLVPNRLVFESVRAGLIKELAEYQKITKEVKVGKGTRLDLVCEHEEKEKCYVEIKNCTLVNEGVAFFPDAVTTRGLKHLVELQMLISSGFRGVMFFLVQRMDAHLLKPAAHIDSAYSEELKRAEQNGVEILVYDVLVDLEKILINKKLQYQL